MPRGSYDKNSGLKLTRTRSNTLTRRNSVSSNTSRELYLDENDTEIFSGVGSENIPSSIAAFHHVHNYEDEDENEEAVNDENDPEEFESSSVPHTGQHTVVLRANSIESGTRPNFKFFTSDEIENAQGVSSTLDDPLIDYDTNWSLNDYETEEELPAEDVVSEESDYRSRLLSNHDRDSVVSSVRNIDNKNWFPGSKLHQQRFYIAEEDLVIGIAGYQTSRVRLFLFYMVNIMTLGLSYLVLRWMPRYRINFYGKPVKLGSSDWVVVENEYGELEVIDVQKQWFNRELSIVFNIKDKEDEEGYEKCPVLLSFEYRYLKLIYNPLEDIFTTNTNWVDTSHWHSASKIRNGLSEYDIDDRKLIFGSNSLDLNQKSMAELLVNEVLHPFYIFQVFSIVLWLLDDYYYYAFCIFFISLVSIVQSLLETSQTMAKLQQISKLNNYPYVRIKRNGFWKEAPLEELVPGDLYELSDPNLHNIPCDSVLISGDCIINESMLTGESVPVTKLPISEDSLKRNLVNYDSTFVTKNQVNGSLSKSYLFSGTKIVRVRRGQGESDSSSVRSSDSEPALALVIKTGFATTKGQLLRSMLFPKPTGFKFYRDAFKYIGFMGAVAAVGFIYSVHNFLQLQLDTKVIVLRAFDIITIVVPPALPATLTIGTNFAVNRLKASKIFCISPSKVNIGGKIDVFCFDKTGTLTEDGLDVLGIHISKLSDERNVQEFTDLLRDFSSLRNTHISQLLQPCDSSRNSRANNRTMYQVLSCLCSCHSLRLVDGELIGDPLDLKMFEFTSWQIEEDCVIEANGKRTVYPLIAKPSGDTRFADTEENYIGVLKVFEFVPLLRRMSVITRAVTTPEYHVFTKGAPEVVCELCTPESLPENYQDLLYKYTHDGYRVIALAGKPVGQKESQRSRALLECQLQFLGFIVFENRLKAQSRPTLEILSHQTGIRTIMCTGDNILTAISVARESSLVSNCRVFIPRLEGQEIFWEDVNDPEMSLDPRTLAPVVKQEFADFRLAITGEVFRHVLKHDELSQDYKHKILMHCDIYARMSPDEKHELVEQLQRLDYTVGFCGDGANDCGALKAADVGVSLSEAEASVAAPFTSTNFEITCVLAIIREGRASLVTSFSCFKYMSLYSAIQFISVSILYKQGSNLGDFQFLWIDLFLILPIAIFMSWSKPYHKIVAKKPSANLVSSKVLIPLVGNIAILLCFQLAVWHLVRREPWYVKPVPGGDDAVQSSDNTVLFLFSNLQYILIAMILTQGPPYRQSSWQNVPFVVDNVVALGLSCLLMAVDPGSWLGDLMQLTWASSGFDAMLVALAAVNFAVLYAGTKYVFPVVNAGYKTLRRGRQKKSKKLFKRLAADYETLGEV